MDDETESTQALVAAARDALTNNLCLQFPFMKTSLANSAVDEAVSVFCRAVEAA